MNYISADNENSEIRYFILELDVLVFIKKDCYQGYFLGSDIYF